MRLNQGTNIKKRKITNVNSLISIKKNENTIKSRTTKIIIDFNCLDSASIQTLTELMSFIYELFETFYFPSKIVKKIYQKYLIEKVYIQHVLTKTNSTCLTFIFINSTDSDILDTKFRELIFEVIAANWIYNRLDSFNIYWENFGTRKENLWKCLGCFEVEHIDNPCLVTVAVNPTEHYQSFEDNSFSKKYKGMKKASSGMDFEKYASKISSLNDCDFFEKLEVNTRQVSI